MLYSIFFKLKEKAGLVINLTIKEKNDLNEVYNCLLVNNRFDYILMILRTIKCRIFRDKSI